jgi:hypothetical protein
MKANRFTVIALMAAAVYALVACGDKKQAAGQTENEEPSVEILKPDSTIFGLCGEATTMNSLQLITDNGDTLSISIIDAQEAGQVFGGLAIGDRMAVIMPAGGSRATMVINQTTLLGDWVMPNPLDGTSEMGIRFKEGGIAESINHGAVLYKTWRLVNGKLEIVSVREGGGDFEETETFQLLYLSADSLSYKDAEETFDLTRPQPEDDYSDLGIDLDDGSLDEMGM